ncbi:MAG: tRNA pseudouridine(55) synthase TruB [Dehalococcoidia bacterium]
MTNPGQPGARGREQITGGFLNVNKPSGMTSMDVIRRVRRMTGQKKIGHGGTLDPDATGVLPLCIGRATRFISGFVEGRKVYRMVGVFGIATDTYDASGRVTAECDASSVTREAVEAALDGFRGGIDQKPPMFSAVKKGGVRLYELARAGEEVEREPRRVEIHSLEMEEWNCGRVVLRAESGRGFYARSLMHDLGLAVGNAAHLAGLVRERVGRFEIAESITLPELEAAAEAGTWQELLHPIDWALEGLPAVVLDPLQEEAVRQGQPVPTGRLAVDGGAITQVRAYARDGSLVALMTYDSVLGALQPSRVIAPA